MLALTKTSMAEPAAVLARASDIRLLM
jgi:cold shock protein